MSGTPMPVPRQPFLSDSGIPLAGGKLYSFLAGTSTAEPIYSDAALTVAHPNPAVLDSAGRIQAFLDPNKAYKFRVETAAGATVYTADNIAGVPSALVPDLARASAYHNTTQSVPDATVTALSLNTEDFDSDGMHDTASNSSRFVVPAGQAGVYLLIGQVNFAANATGIRDACFRKNGTEEFAYTQVAPASASVTTIIRVQALVELVAGDYVELCAYQSSGGALNTGSGTRSTTNILQAARLA